MTTKESINQEYTTEKEEQDRKMNELQLKYGCNPNQKPSRIYMEEGKDLPIKVLIRKTGIYQFP